MEKIAIIGAGGKMGYRISEKLLASDYKDSISFIEVSEVGIARLKELGVNTVSTMEEAVPESDVVILAIPDILIGKLSKSIIPLMKADSLIIGLDPAAAYAGVMPIRDDIGYFVVHPHHPHVFYSELDESGQKDYFGGVARQDISCSLYQGAEKYYVVGEKLARIFFGPVGESFNLTIEQMAYCEPGLVESIGGPLIYAMKLAKDKIVKDLGVPEEAALSFFMGHLRVQIAIIFEMIDAKFSDGAILALEDAMSIIFKDDWMDTMINKEFVTESIAKITNTINK